MVGGFSGFCWVQLRVEWESDEADGGQAEGLSGVSIQLSLGAWIVQLSSCESTSQSHPHCHG